MMHSLHVATRFFCTGTRNRHWNTTRRLISNSTPLPPLPRGMSSGLQLGVDFAEAITSDVAKLGCTRPFILSSNSMRPAVNQLVERLGAAGVRCETFFGVAMGGDEEGLLQACDAAEQFGGDGPADLVCTVGGGAVQDLGKLVRLWLAKEAATGPAEAGKPSVEALLVRAARSSNNTLHSVPQLAVPTGFAQAELTGLAGVTKSDCTKAIFSASCLVPTGIVFDPALGLSAPPWLRYGTALRCVDHAVEAITSPKADKETVELGAKGLDLISQGILELAATEAAEDDDASCAASTLAYLGGTFAMIAFARVGYGAGHFLENQFSARFGVHQGACSSLLMWRVLHYHRSASRAAQERIRDILLRHDCGGGESALLLGEPPSAARLVRELCAATPGELPLDFIDLVDQDGSALVSASDIVAFSKSVFEEHAEVLNEHCPEPFQSAEDVLNLLRTSPEDL